MKASAKIRFGLPESTQISLVVYDVAGRKVSVLLDCIMEAGTHEVVFDASGLPVGSYVYQLITPGRSIARRMSMA